MAYTVGCFTNIQTNSVGRKGFCVIKKVCDASPPGFEPGTFGLEVQRAIHCATGTASYTPKHLRLLQCAVIISG